MFMAEHCWGIGSIHRTSVIFNMNNIFRKYIYYALILTYHQLILHAVGNGDIVFTNESDGGCDVSSPDGQPNKTNCTTPHLPSQHTPSWIYA